MKNILIRTDGRKEIGMGHIIRMLSFALDLKKKSYTPIFILKNSCNETKNLIIKNLFEYILLDINLSFEYEPNKILEISKTFSSNFIIIDSYEIPELYIKTLKQKSNLKILFMDDFCHYNFYYADFIVNVNYGSFKLNYNRPDYSKVFKGEEYFFIRDIYKKEKKKKKFKKNVKYILSLLGSSDYLNFNISICEILNKINQIFKIKTGIMTMNSSTRLETLCSKYKIDLFINPENPAKIISKADIGIINGGLTKYDFAFLGIPALTIPLIEHQEKILKDFEKTGAILNIGNMKNIKKEKIYDMLISLIKNNDKRKEMYENAIKLIDGKGAQRIINLCIK